ncbi:MAG: alpha/beta fold hydrolase [Mycobacterium sp.]
MDSFQLRQVVVGDVRSPVLTAGLDDADLSEAVVFVHGNPGAGSDWRALMEPVSALVPVIAPDMPGFGGAEMRADMDYTVGGYASHLAGLVDELGIARIHLVAHDFGGGWAMTYAGDNPERVASITLINSGVLLDYRWHRMGRIWSTPVVGELFQLFAGQRAARALLGRANPSLDTHWVSRIAAHTRPWGTKRAILRLYRSTRLDTMASLAAAMRNHDLPCLVVWGAEDPYLPNVLAERQREAFPSVQVHVVPGGGHWLWLEKPTEVIELVLPYLRQHISRPG